MSAPRSTIGPFAISISDRIRRAAERIDSSWTLEFIAALRAEVTELAAAAALAPRILAGDLGAEASFRGWLAHAAEYEYDADPESASATNDLDLECGTNRRSHAAGASFVAADILLDIAVAAALVAKDAGDWRTLSEQIIALGESAEWVEELHDAALNSDGAEFESLALLFQRHIAHGKSR